MSDLARVSLNVPAADAEAVADWLLERFPEGLEEHSRGDSVVLSVYVDAAGAEAVCRVFPEAAVEIVQPGWEDRWKDFHRPVVAGGLWIGPPWVAAPDGIGAVVVDPGRAFGTGAHPTTRACIELLSELERGSLLDAGCGSGVVAVAAARLGYSPVAAVDLDVVAVEVARDTARRNGAVVDVSWADVLRDELPAADVVVANIELAVVERLLPRLPAGVVVASGYPPSERPRAEEWEQVARVELEGWAADVLTKRH